jgi:hypothetical protein
MNYQIVPLVNHNLSFQLNTRLLWLRNSQIKSNVVYCDIVDRAMAAQEQNLSPETANTTSKLVWEAKVEAREKKMPPLNIANIIADLSDLNVAVRSLVLSPIHLLPHPAPPDTHINYRSPQDPIPALHLVTANKTLGQVRRRSKPSFISTPSAASYFPSTPSAGNTRRSTPRQSSSESAVSTPGSGPLSPTILRRPGAGKGIAGPKTGDWEALNTTPPTGAGTAAIEVSVHDGSLADARRDQILTVIF